MSGSNASTMIKPQNVRLFKLIPIESFGHSQRHQIVQLSVLFLNALIFGYNKLFRASECIIRFFSIAIFLFVYSIIPCIALSISMVMTTYLLNVTLSDLFIIALEQRSLFVSFGIGFLMFYVAEILMVLYFEGQSGFDSVESHLVQLSAAKYSHFINFLRVRIISMYRETGWDVLGLMVNQQAERRSIMKTELLKQQAMPTDIIGVIDSYLFDKELCALSNSRYQIEQRRRSNDDEQKSATLKPHDIFKMYSSSSSS